MPSGIAWDEIVCASQSKSKPFCHIDQICVECNDDSDCQSVYKHCVDHACKLLSVKACIEGSTKCEDSNAYTCIKKAWENKTICPEGCNIEDTACAVAGETCNKGESKCISDDKLKVCHSNRWVLNDCEPSQVCPIGKTACEAKQCEEGKSNCNAAKNATITCTGNILIETPYEDPTTVCSDDTKRCELPPETCTDATKRCASDFKTVEVCSNMLWEVEEACPNGTICNPDTNQCETIVIPCTDDSTKCATDGTSAYQICKNGKWGQKINCTDDRPVCQYGQCIEYQNDAKRCQGDTVEICKNNAWARDAKCGNRTPACHDGQCVQCTSNACCPNGTCNIKSHKCESTLAESTISWCQSLPIQDKIAYGHVDLPATTPDPNKLSALLLCGKAGQTIREYEILSGSPSENSALPKPTLAYQTVINVLNPDPYLFLWAFSLPDEKSIACSKDGKIITDLYLVPTSANAIAHTIPK